MIVLSLHDTLTTGRLVQFGLLCVQALVNFVVGRSSLVIKLILDFGTVDTGSTTTKVEEMPG